MRGSQKSREQIELKADEDRTFVIFEDKLHQIEVHLTTKNNTATFELRSVLTKYANKTK